MQVEVFQIFNVRVFSFCWLDAVYNTLLPSLAFFWAQQPPVGQGLLTHEVYRSHTTTHHSRWDSSGRVIISSQRPLPDNTQHSQQTNVHDSRGIRTHNLSKPAAADLSLRPCGLWNRLTNNFGNLKSTNYHPISAYSRQDKIQQFPAHIRIMESESKTVNCKNSPQALCR